MSSEPPAPSEPRRRGILLVISAPSGAGKSTLTKLVLSMVTGIEYSVSMSTRPQRAGECDGVDYHFTNVDVFKRLIGEGAFIEHAYVHGNYYGTRRDSVDNALRNGVDLLLDIDIQGAKQIRQQLQPDSVPGGPHMSSNRIKPMSAPDDPVHAIFVFIMPPSMKALEARLRNRSTDSEEAINRRLKNAESEMQCAKEYDYVLVNDDVEAAAARLAEIIKVERMRAMGRALRRSGEMP